MFRPFDSHSSPLFQGDYSRDNYSGLYTKMAIRSAWLFIVTFNLTYGLSTMLQTDRLCRSMCSVYLRRTQYYVWLFIYSVYSVFATGAYFGQ